MITRAEGNAYYAEELLAASSAGTQLPAGLADLLLARMERLSAAAQQVLRTAAVTGRRVDDELVSAPRGSTSWSTTTRSARRSPISCWSRTASRATRSGTRCCARPSTPTCCQASAPGCTRGSPTCSRTSGAWPRCRARPRSWRTTAWPAMTSRARSRPRCRPARRRERLAAPAEAHRHYDQALSLWERVTDPGEDRRGRARQAGVLVGGSAPRTAATPRAPPASCAGCSGTCDEDADRKLLCRVQERLSYFLNDLGEDAAAVAVGAGGRRRAARRPADLGARQGARDARAGAARVPRSRRGAGAGPSRRRSGRAGRWGAVGRGRRPGDAGPDQRAVWEDRRRDRDVQHRAPAGS